MKFSLALLVVCVVFTLVGHTDAGKQTSKARRKHGRREPCTSSERTQPWITAGKAGAGWAKLFQGKCRGLRKLKEDPAFKECSTKAKEAANEDDGMDNKAFGDEGGKKHKGKGMMKMKCMLESKKIIDGNKFQVEAFKTEINTQLSDQPETAATINKLFEECATENKINELDFSDGNKDSWKAMLVCKHKCMKPCMEDKAE